MSKPYKFAWSYSALNTFENCPMKWAFSSYYKEVPYEEGAAQAWGKKVHRGLELRLKKGKTLPKDLAGFERYAQAILKQVAKGAYGEYEKKMGLNRDLKPTGYFDEDVWGRLQADVVLINGTSAATYDWKTGKPNTKDLDQLKLGCMFLLCYYPDLQDFKFKNIWLKDGTTNPPEGQDRVNKQELIKWFNEKYRPRIERMEGVVATEAFDYRPNPLCGWCGANKLGLCDEASRDYEGD